MQDRTTVPIFWMRKLRHRQMKELSQGSPLMRDKTRIQTLVCLLSKLKLLTTQLCLPNQRKLKRRLREVNNLSKVSQLISDRALVQTQVNGRKKQTKYNQRH